MRHWFLVAKSLNESPRHDAGAFAGFMYGGGPDEAERASPEIRRRMFILGAVETLPICTACATASYLEPMFPYAATGMGGLALSLLFCWVLRHQTPHSVIHAASGTDTDADDRSLNAIDKRHTEAL